MSAWTDFYKKTTNPYGTKGPFYTAAGHHGMDFAVAAHATIPAYFTGVCVLNGYSKILGYYSVFCTESGKYVGYAHLLQGTRRSVGYKVQAGMGIGKAAGRVDDHGSAWSGPHCHTTLSGFETGIWDGRTLNPAPYIASKRSAALKPASKVVKHTVKKNETLTKIAAKYKTTVDKVLRLNSIWNENRIYVGQVIRVK